MKIRIIIILLAALVNNSFAQTSRDICSSQITSWTSKPASFTSVSGAKTMIAEIIEVIGLKPNFEVLPANIDNAAAVVYQNKRYILYNPDFISRLNAAAGNKWASISILAHEIGHHLNGHTIQNAGSEPAKELEADEFSGFVLRRMGATLAQAQAAMKIAADYKRSLTHPGSADRLTAIANGWNTANKQQGGKDLAITTPVVKEEQQNTVYNNNAGSNEVRNYPVRTTVQNDAADKYILADVTFAADQQSSFYVTSHFDVVRQINNRLFLIGKMQPTDDTRFPFTITDDSGTKLWVDNTGNIINGKYNSVGFLKVRR
jgi:hypothetical protein